MRVEGRVHLHAATRAGGADREGREKLLRYVLRPPIASERVSTLDNGLVRLTLKRAYSDGTVAVEMAPLSFLCRLAAALPPPRRHLVTYAGVFASASRLRARIAPVRADAAAATADAASKPDDDERPKRGIRRTWAELLARTFRIDVLVCPDCGGRMRLLAVVTEEASGRRYPLRARDRGRGERVLGAHRRRSAVLDEHREHVRGRRGAVGSAAVTALSHPQRPALEGIRLTWRSRAFHVARMEDTRRVAVTIEGPPTAVGPLLTLLRYIEACGRLGTTRWVELMVDGDGGARLAVSIDGAPRPLGDAEIAYLFEGEGAGTPELRVRAEASDDGSKLRVELA